MQIDPNVPLVSIGMPVRNEERFIREALEALLAQEDVRMELIISDNASTDATPDICREYAERYPALIRYNRFEDNVGAGANFAWVLEQAVGEYFMWASGHDLWEPNYLKSCTTALQAAPNAMIAFGSTHWIDAAGAPYPRATGWSDTRGLSLAGRYFTVFWGNMNPIIAVLRTAAIKEEEVTDMIGVDLCLLLALSLKGNFLHCPDTAWSRRENRDEVSYEQKLKRYRSGDFALDKSLLARIAPLARLPVRILRDLLGSRLGAGQKLLLAVLLLASLPVKYLSDRQRKPHADGATV
jgi:glycosyltransferase involved in cell wall biosynthesis